MPKATESSTTLPPLMSGKAALAMLDASGQLVGDGGADAELIRLCTEFNTLERLRIESFPGEPRAAETEEKLDVLLDEISEKQDDLAERIVAIPPQTLAGVRAMARSIVLWAPDMLNDACGELAGLHGTLNSALLRALIGGVRS